MEKPTEDKEEQIAPLLTTYARIRDGLEPEPEPPHTREPEPEPTIVCPKKKKNGYRRKTANDEELQQKRLIQLAEGRQKLQIKIKRYDDLKTEYDKLLNLYSEEKTKNDEILKTVIKKDDLELLMTKFKELTRDPEKPKPPSFKTKFKF